MRFTSTWEQTADKKGISLDPVDGNHDPAWDDLDKHTQQVIVEALVGADAVIEQLLGKEPEGRSFYVRIFGFAGDETPGKGSDVRIDINELRAAGVESMKLDEMQAEAQAEAEEAKAKELEKAEKAEEKEAEKAEKAEKKTEEKAAKKNDKKAEKAKA